MEETEQRGGRGRGEKKRLNRIIMRPIILHTHIPPAFRVNQRARLALPPATCLDRVVAWSLARSQGVTEGSPVGMGREGGGGGGGREEGAVDLNRASVRKPISCLPSPAIPLLLGCALPPAWPVAVNVEEAKGQLGSVGWERESVPPRRTRSISNV